MSLFEPTTATADRKMSTDILEHARKQIDAEILELQQRIRSLRSKRNTLSPMHQLPPEVTTEIFTWIQLVYRGSVERGASYTGLLHRWIRVTQICRHWRNIALNSRSLYGTILTHNLRYSEETLKLAGTAALSIIDSLDHSTELMWQTPKLQELVLAALPRVRNLWLSHRAQEFLLPHLEKSDLVLQELCLSRWNKVAPTMFPSSLRYLQLYCCLFRSYDWLSRLSNMVELSLITTSPHQYLPLDALLNALDGMPRLISLELSGMLSAPKVHWQRTSPVAPKLQSLTLRDTPDNVAQFLPWVTFAPQFSIDLFVKSSQKYNEPEETAEWLPPLLEQLGQHFYSSQMVLRTAKFEGNDKKAYERESTMLFFDATGKVRLQLTVLLKNQDQLQTWLKSTQALPLDDIISVEVAMDAPADAVDWNDGPWNSGIRSLRKLIISGEEASMSFLRYLTSNEATGPTESPPHDFPPSFASLEQLSLHDAQCDQELELKLQAVLQARREKTGVKFRKLILNHCVVSPESIRGLQKVVKVVEQRGGQQPEPGKKKHSRISTPAG